jgi:hypothetical protein
MMPLMLFVLILIYALYAFALFRLRKDGQDSEDNRMVLLGEAVLLSLLAFILFGKVFSSQYLVWLIPPIVYMIMMSAGRTQKRYILILTIIVIALTQLNFAVNIGISGGGAGITDAGMMIILARNIAALALFAYVIRTPIGCVKRRIWDARSKGSGTE